MTAVNLNNGNKLFKEISENGSKSQFWKKKSYDDCLRHYEQGKHHDHPDSHPTCYRSIGVVCIKILTECNDELSGELPLYYYSIGLFNFAMALELGLRTKKNAEWINGIIEKFVRMRELASHHITNVLNDQWQIRCSFIEKLIDRSCGETKLGASLIKILFYAVISKELEKAMIKSDEENDWAKVVYLSEEICRPMMLAKDFLSRPFPSLDPMVMHVLSTRKGSIQEELTETENSVKLYRARADSSRFRSLADEEKERLFFQNENYDEELLFVCLDHYAVALSALRKEGGSTAEYICYESAAKICVGMAELLGNNSMLNLEDKAHTLYLRSIQFADIVTHTNGATYFSCAWYQKAKQEIEKYRKRKEAFDNKAREEARAPMLEKLKPQLDSMDACYTEHDSKATQAYKFLVYVYKTHPPKDPKEKLFDEKTDRFDKKRMKRACLSAAAAYHPDKACNKENGMEWSFLSEEISKRINGFYSFYKDQEAGEET
jgi:hypothetical protein